MMVNMRGHLVSATILVTVVTGVVIANDDRRGPPTDGADPPIVGERDAVTVARESITVPASDVAVTPSPSELDDLGVIANQEGLPLEEAVRKFGWQGAFGAAIDAVEKRYPAKFSGSSMQTDGDLGATIELTGQIPADIADLITDVPVPVTVTGDARHSEQQVRDAVEAAHYAARAEPSTGQVSTEYAEESGTIIVTAYGEGTASAARSTERDSVEQSAERAVAAKVGQIPVEVQYAPVGGAGPEAIRGEPS